MVIARWLIVRFIPVAVLLILSVLISCNPAYKIVRLKSSEYKVDGTKNDSSFISFLKPFSDSLSKSMSDVLVRFDARFEKGRFGGSLGNLMTDAIKFIVEAKSNDSVDAAFVNTGGIRRAYLGPGDITRGHVYELMPFDNAIIILKVPGITFKEFLDHIAGRGGWPVSGMTYQIKEKKAYNILIRNQSLEESKIYTVALTDYIANGGEQSGMLKHLPQKAIGYYVRDVLIEYFLSVSRSGKTISNVSSNRVTYAE